MIYNKEPCKVHLCVFLRLPFPAGDCVTFRGKDCLCQRCVEPLSPLPTDTNYSSSECFSLNYFATGSRTFESVFISTIDQMFLVSCRHNPTVDYAAHWQVVVPMPAACLYHVIINHTRSAPHLLSAHRGHKQLSSPPCV